MCGNIRGKTTERGMLYYHKILGFESFECLRSAISEAKQQKGACCIDTKFLGLESFECLRSASVTGGIMAWLSKMNRESSMEVVHHGTGHSYMDEFRADLNAFGG